MARARFVATPKCASYSLARLVILNIQRAEAKAANRELRKAFWVEKRAYSKTFLKVGKTRIFDHCIQKYLVTTLATHWTKQLSLEKENDWAFFTVLVFRKLVQNLATHFYVSHFFGSLWTAKLQVSFVLKHCANYLKITVWTDYQLFLSLESLLQPFGECLLTFPLPFRFSPYEFSLVLPFCPPASIAVKGIPGYLKFTQMLLSLLVHFSHFGWAMGVTAQMLFISWVVWY